MKKIVALVAVLFSVVVPVQSQAAVGERIVIVDDYFNRSLISGSVEFVCVATDRCVNNSSVYSHGTQVALVARQQNPDATIVLVQAAAVAKNGSIGSVNLNNLVDSLKWASVNTSNVSAVSFSRFMNHASKACMPPASAPYTPETGYAAVNSYVVALKSKGIPVIAAAGNHNKAIDFPACIPDVVSVGAVGGVNGSFQATTADVVVSTASYRISPTQNIPQFTSSATAAVAAMYKSINIATTKVVTIP